MLSAGRFGNKIAARSDDKRFDERCDCSPSAVINEAHHTEIVVWLAIPKYLNLDLIALAIGACCLNDVWLVDRLHKIFVTFASPRGQLVEEDLTGSMRIHGSHGKNYLRAKRSKSAICFSISSRALSEAERTPWMRRRNSSGLEERERASSSVISCLV